MAIADLSRANLACVMRSAEDVALHAERLAALLPHRAREYKCVSSRARRLHALAKQQLRPTPIPRRPLAEGTYAECTHCHVFHPTELIDGRLVIAPHGRRGSKKGVCDCPGGGVPAQVLLIDDDDDDDQDDDDDLIDPDDPDD